jgi:hypothetical protein
MKKSSPTTSVNMDTHHMGNVKNFSMGQTWAPEVKEIDVWHKQNTIKQYGY